MVRRKSGRERRNVREIVRRIVRPEMKEMKEEEKEEEEEGDEKINYTNPEKERLFLKYARTNEVESVTRDALCIRCPKKKRVFVT